MLPILGMLAGNYLAGAGALGGLSALGAGAIGSGLGGFLQTGNLGQGIMTGLSSYMGGSAYGNLAGNAFPGASVGGFGAEQLGQMAGSGIAGLSAIQPEMEGMGARFNRGTGQSAYSQERLMTPVLRQQLQRKRPNIKGYSEGGIMEMSLAQKLNDKELINAAQMVLMNPSDKEATMLIISEFIARFGKEALDDFIEKALSGEVAQTAGPSEGRVMGAGDAMDDLVPATNQNGDDILLSNNEYIVAGDIVSSLGNGDSESGAEVLDDMVDNIRVAKTGRKEQPPRINPREYVVA